MGPCTHSKEETSSRNCSVPTLRGRRHRAIHPFNKRKRKASRADNPLHSAIPPREKPFPAPPLLRSFLIVLLTPGKTKRELQTHPHRLRPRFFRRNKGLRSPPSGSRIAYHGSNDIHHRRLVSYHPQTSGYGERGRELYVE